MGMKYAGEVNMIVAYDVSGRKVVKVHKMLSEELYWEQNSVFFGEAAKGGALKIRNRLLELIDPAEDSVIIYQLLYPWSATVERWGKLPPWEGFVE